MVLPTRSPVICRWLWVSSCCGLGGRSFNAGFGFFSKCRKRFTCAGKLLYGRRCGWFSQFTSWLMSKQLDVSMALNGILAGLVGITAGADQMATRKSVVIEPFPACLFVLVL